MAFSGAVKLGDLNDFIAPSQACVVNLAPKGKFDTVDLQVDTVQLPTPKNPTGGFQQTQLAGDAVKISLQDCLACSGCVTTAETMLLEHQSVEELLTALQSGKTVIVSVSPQSRASLAVLHKLSPSETLGKLVCFLKALGVKAVLDTSTSRDLALLESAQEFIARYKAKHPEHAAPAISQARPSGAATSPDITDRLQSHANASTSQSGGEGTCSSPSQGHTATASSREEPAGPLPMLASACPGWVCYAEKTHGSYILPYISTAKSPQAVMGTLVKRFVSRQLGVDPSQIYHCAVMPCYDKKLESSRDDFFLPGSTIPEVDSVLTTAEVQQLVEQRGIDLTQLPTSPVDPLLLSSSGNSIGSSTGNGSSSNSNGSSGKSNSNSHTTRGCNGNNRSSGCNSSQCDEGQLYGVHGGAGGYLEFIFRTAAEQLFNRTLPAGPLQMKTLRNADFKEVTLEADGRTVLRFAAAYGFRNIQTLVRKIKRQACEYDYVEVMACPSACLNGGGQIKAHKGQTSQQLLNELDESYHAPEVIERHPADNPLVPLVYDQLIGSGQFSAAARSLLHTGYHHRTKTVSASIGDW